MRVIRLCSVAVLTVLSLAVNGCMFFHDAYRVDPAVARKPPCGLARAVNNVAKGQWTDPTIYLDQYEFPGEALLKPTPENALAYLQARAHKEDRDRLAAQVVALSNDMCFKHMGDYISQQSLTELLIGGAVLGLTAGGSVAASAATKLAAAATGLGGLRTLVDDTVYYKQLTPAIMKRAIAERNKLLYQIAAKLQVNSLEGEDVGHHRSACYYECPSNVAQQAREECIKNLGCATKKEEDQPACKAKCPLDEKWPYSKPGGLLVDACRARCVTTRIFPCPNMLQADIAGAQKAASEADDDVAKAKGALKATIEGVGKLGIDSAAKASLVETAVRYKMTAEADKKKEGDKSKPPLCRPWKDYAIDDVLADLTQYHDACSFYRALAVAAEDIQKSADAINKDLQGIYKTAAKEAVTGNKPAASGESPQIDPPKAEPTPAP